MRLHHDEVPIDTDLVRRLLRAQFSELAEADLRPAPTQGTDNLMFRLGSRLVVRLPRKPAAVSGLLVERRWLPILAPRLPLAVPLPIADGLPTRDYPFPWAVCRWLPGSPVPAGGLATGDVRRLAEFIRTLHSVEAPDGPPVEAGRRAGPVMAYSPIFEPALGGVLDLVAAGRIEPGLVDPDRARTVWQAAHRAPSWSGPGVWVHRDLYGGNLLAETGRLTGVIDFGSLAVGDPAGDVMAAFHVVEQRDRPAFREAVGADDSSWARARGWALVQGLEALPYYLDTHPGMVAMARQAISAALSDDGQTGSRAAS